MTAGMAARAQSAGAELPPGVMAAGGAGRGTGRPFEIQKVSAETRVRLGAHGECPHGCPPGGDPCPACNSSCCDADRYPDEYLCDGGDREEPVHYDDDGMIGLETQDTVAEFRDGTGKRRVRRTNEVCVYAPRFSSVTVVSGALEDGIQSRANQHVREAQQIAIHRPHGPATAQLDESAERMVSKVRGTVILNADLAYDVNLPVALVEHANDLVPITTFGFLQTGSYKQAQEAYLATQLQIAHVWTRDQNPVIVAKDDAVQLVESRFKIEELAGSDVKGPGNLKIVKLADVKTAAQGDEITFTIRYQNQGDSPVSEVTIVDNLTPRLEYVEGSEKNDRASRFDAVDNGEGSVILRWELDEPLPGRTTGVITFRAKVR
ncbi:MAG: hypothetical protein NT069_28520 [Planctomycetota bacterium]|nr:hypothetical protein [Planctomycetota bacterium]